MLGLPYTVKFARVNADSDGDNTVVSAVTGKKIQVLGYAFGSSSAATATIKSGTTVLAEFVLAANGHLNYSGGPYAPAFETAAGEALIVNTAASQDVNGHIAYIEV